jgi:flagellar basal-body rod protein FlgG
MNASTPGFKRLRVTLIDAYGPAWQDGTPASDASDLLPDGRFRGEGCRMAPLVIDLTQGRLKKTERQFDLAIEGEGYFVVRQGEREFLTRCGALTLDSDRQLALSVTNENSVLQPALRIPDDACEVQISANGTVTMLKAPGSDLVNIGQFKIGKVASPSRLTPAGQTLLVANEASGSVTMAAPMSDGLGEIQQGCLEQSNVDFEKELEQIEELTQILRSLPVPVSRPATARGPATTPQH